MELARGAAVHLNPVWFGLKHLLQMCLNGQGGLLQMPVRLKRVQMSVGVVGMDWREGWLLAGRWEGWGCCCCWGSSEMFGLIRRSMGSGICSLDGRVCRGMTKHNDHRWSNGSRLAGGSLVESFEKVPR